MGNNGNRDPVLKEILDGLYKKYNYKKWIHPDPLEFVYLYNDDKDREIAGLIASSLAYGRVAGILKSVSSILKRTSPSPFCYLMKSTKKSLKKDFFGFKHRFTTGDDMADLLFGAKSAIKKFGSLEDCFLKNVESEDKTYMPALISFVENLSPRRSENAFYLLPNPRRKSACKRLNLFLRWMVRDDRVDPGTWSNADPSMLVAPLDTHLHRISKAIGLCDRKQADLKAAIQITEGFRRIRPDDPVRYDFCLTRLGIRAEQDPKEFISTVKRKSAMRNV